MTSLIEQYENAIRDGVDRGNKIVESDLYKGAENIFNNTKQAIDDEYNKYNTNKSY